MKSLEIQLLMTKLKHYVLKGDSANTWLEALIYLEGRWPTVSVLTKMTDKGVPIPRGSPPPPYHHHPMTTTTKVTLSAVPKW